jgi:hypothetical protein
MVGRHVKRLCTDTNGLASVLQPQRLSSVQFHETLQLGVCSTSKFLIHILLLLLEFPQFLLQFRAFFSVRPNKCAVIWASIGYIRVGTQASIRSVKRTSNALATTLKE